MHLKRICLLAPAKGKLSQDTDPHCTHLQQSSLKEHLLSHEATQVLSITLCLPASAQSRNILQHRNLKTCCISKNCFAPLVSAEVIPAFPIFPNSVLNFQ